MSNNESDDLLKPIARFDEKTNFKQSKESGFRNEKSVKKKPKKKAPETFQFIKINDSVRKKAILKSDNLPLITPVVKEDLICKNNIIIPETEMVMVKVKAPSDEVVRSRSSNLKGGKIESNFPTESPICGEVEIVNDEIPAKLTLDIPIDTESKSRTSSSSTFTKKTNKRHRKKSPKVASDDNTVEFDLQKGNLFSF